MRASELHPWQAVEGARVLIIDDEQDNLELMSRALRQAGFPDPFCLSNPLEAAHTYQQLDPEVVLLDLRMTPVDGFHVLAQLSGLELEEGLAPVIMITGSTSDELRKRALTAGVTDFVQRDFDPTEIVLRTRNHLHSRRLFLQVQRQKEWLEETVRVRTQELRDAQHEIIERLALAAEFRDDQTGEHTKRVAALSQLIAEHLGQSRQFVEAIASAAQLHDLGKIGIPDAILHKPGPLSVGEYELLKGHTIIGYKILENCTEPVLLMARDIAVSHHERWDGTGYPHGLHGDSIPIAGRIVSVADTFDAITNERAYKPALGPETALDEIARHRGTQFDPNVVDALQDSLSSSFLPKFHVR